MRQQTEIVETPTMLRADDASGGTRLVELLAVDRAYPLYGTFTLEDGRPYAMPSSPGTARSCAPI